MTTEGLALLYGLASSSAQQCFSNEFYFVCPLVRIGPPPSPASVPPSETKGGGTHSPAGEGVGGQFGRLEKKPSTPSTLCLRQTLFLRGKIRLKCLSIQLSIPYECFYC
jgi:hypothetical protein